MDRLVHCNLVVIAVLGLAACGGGGSGTSTAPTPPAQTQAPTVSLSANPTSINGGQSSTLSWSSSNATACSASGGWSGSQGTSGSFSTGALTATTQYSLTCTGAGGSASAAVTVTVGSSQPAAPQVTLSASPPGVSPGGQTTLTWNSSNTTSCTASGGWSGGKPVSGSQSVGPLQSDTTFNLTCAGPGGNAIAMTTVSVRIARLSWDAPTQNVDGSALTDLAGYRVFWGTSPRNYAHNTLVNGAGTTFYDVSLSPGTWYFAVTARNAGGDESAYSGEVSKTVN